MLCNLFIDKQMYYINIVMCCIEMLKLMAIYYGTTYIIIKIDSRLIPIYI